MTSIDVDHNTITFTDPNLFKVPPGFTAIPLTLDDGIPQTVAVVNNTQPISVQLATGEFGNWFSLGRKKAVNNFRLDRFVIPEIKSSGYPFDGMNTSQVSQGALGHNTLTSFDLIFDYPDLKLFLAAPKS